MPEPTDLLSEAETLALAFHEQTKLSYRSVRGLPYQPNWEDQPSPYREYQDAPLLLLDPNPPTRKQALGEVSKNLTSIIPVSEEFFNLDILSYLFKYSLSLNCWKKLPHSSYKYALRVNPSCGNLHPVETYFLLGNKNPYNGFYHYNVLENALEKRSKLDLRESCAKASGYPEFSQMPSLVFFSAIPWRSVWKFRARGYRYALCDVGHAVASFMFAASSLNIPVTCITNFPDIPIKEVLGLSSLREEPFALLALGKPLSVWKYPTLKPEEIPSSHDFSGIPNTICQEEVHYPSIDEFHQNSQTDIADMKPPITTDQRTSSNDLDNLIFPYERAAFFRRSALGFVSGKEMKQGDFQRLLQCLTLPLFADFLGSIFQKARISWLDYYFFIHHVEGLSPGLYHYQLESGELECLASGNFSHEAKYLNLEQSLAGDGFLTLCMVGNFSDVLKVFRQRGYRHLFFEAGILGQILYFFAESIGVRATALGAFYDEELGQYLRLNTSKTQVVYSFSIGIPARDPRKNL